MTMTNPVVVVSDLEARWRPLSAQESTNALAFLDDAWAMLLSRRPDLESYITAGTVSDATVVRVVCAMVLRVMKNPDGYDSESLDDYTYRRNAVIASGLLHVTPDELGDLTPVAARRQSVRLVIYGDS